MSRARTPIDSVAEDSAWTDVTGVFDRELPLLDEGFESTWERPAFRPHASQVEGVRSLRPSSRAPSHFSEDLTPAPTASVVGAYARLMVDYALERGVDVVALGEQFGLEGLLDDSDERVPFDSFRAWCETIADLLDEPDLGLNAGRRV